MSRHFEPEEQREDSPRDFAGHVGSTTAGSLTMFALAGLVLGWLLRPVSIWFNDSAPTVGWLSVSALLFVALIVGSVAWVTHRTLHKRRESIAAHQAVNRLVLAKSCALAGAMVSGGYFGYALSWVGLTQSDLARERFSHSLVGGLAGALVVVAALLLERACRVRDDTDRDLV